MTKYTIAYMPVLFATVPDGENVIEAAAAFARTKGLTDFDAADLIIVPGLTLTNELPDPDEEPAWRGPFNLTDEDGQSYQYAVTEDEP